MFMSFTVALIMPLASIGLYLASGVVALENALLFSPVFCPLLVNEKIGTFFLESIARAYYSSTSFNYAFFFYSSTNCSIALGVSNINDSLLEGIRSC